MRSSIRLVLCSLALSLVAAPLVSAYAADPVEVTRLPGDVPGAARAWAFHTSATWNSGHNNLPRFITVQPDEHITVETITVRIVLPTGQIPNVALSALLDTETGPSSTRFVIALQRQGSFATPQGEQTTWTATHSVRIHLDGFSAIEIARQGGVTGGVSIFVSLAGYATTSPTRTEPTR